MLQKEGRIGRGRGERRKFPTPVPGRDGFAWDENNSSHRVVVVIVSTRVDNGPASKNKKWEHDTDTT